MYMIHICEIIIFICNIYIIMNIYVYDTWQTIFFLKEVKLKRLHAEHFSEWSMSICNSVTMDRFL